MSTCQLHLDSPPEADPDPALPVAFQHGPQFPLRWRVRTRLAQRFGWPCRMRERGAKNSCVIEFPDGYKVVTSRNYVRKATT